MKEITAKEILHLSLDKRIELVCEIWDSIASVPEAVELANDERALLDERMEAHQKDPKAGSPLGNGLPVHPDSTAQKTAR